jgi:serine phosphatase RsbU (regulator of sigma subunit)
MLVKHTVPIQIAQHLITKCPKGTKDGKLRALEAPKPAAAATARPAIPAPKRPPAVVSIESAPQAVAAEATSKNAADRTARKPRTMIHMPASTPTDIPGYTFATHFGSHAEIPKDFCDFISLGGGQLGVVIADVSTAGIEGALVMSMARKVISLNARLSGDPREVLIKTNAELFPDLGRKICVSCTYGLLDPESHRYTCARAGHNFVLVYRATSKEVEIVRSNGMSLGLDGGTMFERVIQEATVDVGPGDTIFEYNYGLTETSNDQREEFGAERLTAVIQRYGRYEVGDLVRKVAGAVAEFAGGASRRNDELLLAIRRD